MNFLVLAEASPQAAGGVQAADQYPVASAQEIRYLFPRTPGQRCPCLLLSQQEDNRAGGVAGDGELAAACRRDQHIAGG